MTLAIGIRLAYSTAEPPELTEDQLLARKEWIYALRHEPEAKRRCNGRLIGYFDNVRHVCALGLFMDLHGVLDQSTKTTDAIEYAAARTGWSTSKLSHVTNYNDQELPWSYIASFLEGL
jgi:hypothetical protein